MKDFDFDELDRAVNSVLATKNTKTTENPDDSNTAQPVDVSQPADESSREDAITVNVGTPAPQDAPDEATDHSSDDATEPAVTEEPVLTAFEPTVPSIESHEDTSHDEKSHEEESHEEEAPNHDNHTSDQPEEESNSDDNHGVSGEDSIEDAHEPKAEDDGSTESSPQDDDLAAIPVKRGRFMDVMTPSGDMNDGKKSGPSRTGVTLTPSADFETTTDSEKELSEQLSTFSSETSKDDKAVVTDESNNEESIVEAEAEPSTDAAAVADQESTEQAEESTENPTPESPSTPESYGGDTPFIPDVPVEKRPLNSMSPLETDEDDSESDSQDEPKEDDAQKSESSDTEPTPEIMQPSVSNAPKEFNKEIMAVEANETIATASTSAPATSSTASADAHPLFDTSSLGDHAHDHHTTSKMTWVIILGSLFLVGAALGVLYFLYGQA